MKEKIESLEVGETCYFDISKTGAARAIASLVSKEKRRKYTTKTDVETDVVIVRRVM